MKCEKCGKNEATFFYRENINGKEKKYSLCENCARELEQSGELDTSFDVGFNDFMSPVNSILQGLFAPMETMTSIGTKRCPLCGSTLNQIADEGKVGCAQCYDTFGNELNSTIKRIHGNSVHTGRVPPKFKKEPTIEDKIGDKEKELKKAVAEENFEMAAKLRDEIKDMKDRSNDSKGKKA